MFFGSERPLDDPLAAKPFLALDFELFRGSVVRWYLEGETEFGAIEYILARPAVSGVELINLRGKIAADRDNVALQLQEWFLQDIALGRFSIISFDKDVQKNVNFIRRQVEKENIVGYIDANNPDFEFANFNVHVLVKVAAHMDEADGLSVDQLHKADWSAVQSGRQFEAKYRSLSARGGRALKGAKWGVALAVYALAHPNRSDTGEERPIWNAIRAAGQSRMANHAYQREKYRFDPQTFALVER